jgi:HrpA-like RNA helicase
LVQVRGRQYPVQMLYTVHPQEDFIDAALHTCIQVIYKIIQSNILQIVKILYIISMSSFHVFQLYSSTY